jgi:osomolarity two-component system sensor histidine kinase SLN1
MTDELVKQYTSLDEKVAERTRELEISKRAAEAANESKTLFIANISHELKTPLNGIMGICAVCMEDDDILRIQHSLKTLYRSGMYLALRYRDADTTRLVLTGS